MRCLPFALILTTACNRLLDTPDLHLGPCDPGAEFMQVAPVGGLENEVGMQSARLSRDELSIVFSRLSTGGSPEHPRFGDLYMAHRDDRADDFGRVAAINELNSDFDEFSASLSDDRLMLYFDRQDHGTRYEILAATRPGSEQAFGAPTAIQLGDATRSNYNPFITPAAIYFASRRDDSLASLFMAAGHGLQFAAPQNVMSIETLISYEAPIVAFDGLTIYFSAVRDGTAVARHIWSAARSAPEQRFGLPRAVAALDTAGLEWPTWISEDNCRLYFMAKQDGAGSTLWIASRRTP